MVTGGWNNGWCCFWLWHGLLVSPFGQALGDPGDHQLFQVEPGEFHPDKNDSRHKNGDDKAWQKIQHSNVVGVSERVSETLDHYLVDCQVCQVHDVWHFAQGLECLPTEQVVYPSWWNEGQLLYWWLQVVAVYVIGSYLHILCCTQILPMRQPQPMQSD